MRTDRLLTLSEDLPWVSVAVDTRDRIETALDEVMEVKQSGLVTLERANDHFIPGIAADPSTSGATAHLGLFYYNYPVAACSYLDPENPSNQCLLRMGFVSSTDGGATWSDPVQLASMDLPNLVRSSQGLMVGDYSTGAVIPAGPNKGNAIAAFAVGVTDQTLDQAMYVPNAGVPIGAGTNSRKAQKASEDAIETAEQQGVRRQPNVPPHRR